MHGRRIRVRAAITDGDEPLAEARAALLHVPLEHFLADARRPRGGRALARAQHDLADAADGGGSSAAARELSSETSGARSGVVCARSIRSGSAPSSSAKS